MSTLLEQAIKHKDVPAGTVQHIKSWKDWTRLQRPKGTKCPFGDFHATKRNVLIRPTQYGYKLICMADRCKGKSVDRDTAEDEACEDAPVYTADMF